jgi:hypothetical protein
MTANRRKQTRLLEVMNQFCTGSVVSRKHFQCQRIARQLERFQQDLDRQRRNNLVQVTFLIRSCLVMASSA